MYKLLPQWLIKNHRVVALNQGYRPSSPLMTPSLLFFSHKQRL